MNPQPPDNDERLSAWHSCMDGEDAPPADAEALSAAQQHQLADEQLLHALLVHHYTDSADSTHRRVERVLHAITPRPAKPLWFRLARATLSSAAALVLVVLFIEFLLPQTTSATAGFDRVVNAFMNDGDRAYSIRFSMKRTDDDNAPASRPADLSETNSDSPRPMRRHPGPGHPREATLYLRGSNQYLFELKLPHDETVWIGQGSQNAWAVRPGGAVLVSEDRDAFHLPFFEEMTTIPLIDVRDTLQTASHGYKLDPPRRVTMDDGRKADYFIARREGREEFRPQRIELWADPQTGLIYRMICSTMHFEGLVCMQLRMDYINSNTLPADWFEYPGHASSEAQVKTVTREDMQRFRRQKHRMPREHWKHHRGGDPHHQPPQNMPPPPPPPPPAAEDTKI